MLILLERSYIGRFWTQFEAWLSMRLVTERGLSNVPRGGKLRCHITMLSEAPLTLKAALQKDWRYTTTEEAYETLKRSDVVVTNERDKNEQLPKIQELDGEARKSFEHPGRSIIDASLSLKRIDVTKQHASTWIKGNKQSTT